jgi:hypothetical protein
MSGEALLATPARPFYEPSHRRPKKAPEVALFLLQITRPTGGRFIRGRHFLDLGLVAAVNRSD